MHSQLLFLAQNVFLVTCAIFAYCQGGRSEKLGAIWFGVNMAIGVATALAGLTSPVVFLIVDGVFALGLLPLAMIYVSYWMGLLTLIAAALFTLEAIYLLNDRAIDTLYLWVNNILWGMAPLVLLMSGVVNLRRKRRLARAARLEREAEGAVPA